VVLDELLVAQEDLLSAEDGRVGPGVEGAGAGVGRRLHLCLGGFGHPAHHLVSGLGRTAEDITHTHTHTHTHTR